MPNPEQDLQVLEHCLRLAERAGLRGEVPVGSVIVDSASGEVVAKAYNLRETLNSPLAHAETLAIHRASRILGRWRLTGFTLYTSLEPCVMCSGVILQARLDRVVFSARDPKGGGHSLFQLLNRPELNHRPQVDQGPLAEESQALMQDFFRKRR